MPISRETTAGKRSAAAQSATKEIPRAKPGNKKGAAIRRVPKLKEYRVKEIVGQIEIRSRERPERPYTYAELAEVVGYSTVTLRRNQAISAAIERARQIATAHLEASDDSADELRSSLQRLKDENRELKAELQWYRAEFQRTRLLARQSNSSDATRREKDNSRRPQPISRF
jgi:hypothetical protein